jgi:hypothetical protein
LVAVIVMPSDVSQLLTVLTCAALGPNACWYRLGVR